MKLLKNNLLIAKRATIFFIASISLFTPALALADNITFVAPILGQRLNTQDGKGFWGDMFRQITEGQKPAQRLTSLPFKRSLVDFAARKFDCFWSMDKKLLRQLGLDDSKLIESTKLFVATQRVFLAPGQPMISSVDELSGKRVGIGSGSNFEKRLREASAKVVLLSDQGSKLRMLENDRIDAFIGWLPDALIMEYDTKINPNLVSSSLLLTSTGITFVCHNTSKNADFINQINSAIATYKTSDQFTDLFESYGATQMLENRSQ